MEKGASSSEDATRPCLPEIRCCDYRAAPSRGEMAFSSLHISISRQKWLQVSDALPAVSCATPFLLYFTAYVNGHTGAAHGWVTEK